MMVRVTHYHLLEIVMETPSLVTLASITDVREYTGNGKIEAF